MRLIRSFTLCTLNGINVHEVNERDIDRLAHRQPHADNHEVFAVQVRADGPKLTLVGLVIAKPNIASVSRYRPGTNVYKGSIFTMGEDLATKQTGKADLDAFLAHIKREYEPIAA